jgi:hypothetical protein
MNITMLAAKPAGTQGVSSFCNIHQRTKNNTREAAAAAVMKPEADGGRTGPRGLGNEESRGKRDRFGAYNPGSCVSIGNALLAELKGGMHLLSLEESD